VFLGQKSPVLVILALMSCLGVIQSLACETPQPQTFQTLQLHKNHLHPVLTVLSTYKDSPAQIWAQKINDQFKQCDLLAAQIPSTDAPLQLLQNLQCQPVSPHVTSTANFQLHGFQWAMNITKDAKETLVGRMRLSPSATASQSSILLPAQKPVDFSFINEDKALFSFQGHSADGRGLYGLLLDNSQVQNLFGLGTIVGRLLFDSRWAAALYPPTNKASVPMLVLAAGLSSDTVKNSLVTQFEKALTQQYQLESRILKYADFIGKCFSPIPLFPALAPCIVTGSQSAVIAWNEEALKMATQESKQSASTQAGFRGHWDWNAIEEANKVLSETTEAPIRPGAINIEGRQTQEGYEYTFQWLKERR
jgi:hypothetical protein